MASPQKKKTKPAGSTHGIDSKLRTGPYIHLGALGPNRGRHILEVTKTVKMLITVAEHTITTSGLDSPIVSSITGSTNPAHISAFLSLTGTYISLFENMMQLCNYWIPLLRIRFPVIHKWMGPFENGTATEYRSERN